MSTAAPVQEVRPSKPSPGSLAPEERERLLFARVMVLLIVPLYVLILLTIKGEARPRIARIGEMLELDMTVFVPYFRRAYHGLIVLACAATPLYCVLGLVKLALRGAGRRYLLAGALCVVVAIAEAVAIALAVYRYQVKL
ncbi:MAG TPA: hypothetical protein VGH33_26350 [Isosphaeraceae bacterium]|jgi:hypothetical protein